MDEVTKIIHARKSGNDTLCGEEGFKLSMYSSHKEMPNPSWVMCSKCRDILIDNEYLRVV